MSDDHDISKLYALPLAEFTTARNALAKQLRSAGDREAADEIKRLGKPTVSAWAVNQLYHEHRSTFDEFLAAGRAQRQAVQSGSEKLRSVNERKRALQAELLKTAGEILGREKTRLSPVLRQRISRSLDALAARPPEADTPPLGRITADVEPTGFDALLGAQIAPATAGQGTKRPPAPAAKRATAPATQRATAPVGGKTAAARRRLKTARDGLAGARRDLASARKVETAAKGKLTRAEARTERSLTTAKAAELAAERARDTADEAQLALRKARAERDRAAQASERQEAKLDSAQRKLDGLV